MWFPCLVSGRRHKGLQSTTMGCLSISPLSTPEVETKTPLERQLENDDSEKPSPIRALDVARRRFLNGGQVDMGLLATEIGVSRATLYRWVGSREKLLGEILYTIADAAFTRAERTTAGSGVERLLGVLERFYHGILEPGPYRDFLEQDAELALRLCSSKHGPVQRRLILRLTHLLNEETISVPDTSPEDLAYALLRIGDSFVYSDVITGGKPDVHTAVVIWSRLLRN